ncbi:hypothetical protein KI387_014326 [Taxus chinensis]|uniref:PPM-type phosphatase domain-containing protein n=1 Tax=Taxus chinensis TaxID=29808 RepID=A0AA38CQI8_TAXCH|nr:hypothetical protein KI387_014326 [Taxus chinensis]
MPRKFKKAPPKAEEILALEQKRWDVQYVAVRRFGGFVSDYNFGEEASELQENLSGSPWEPSLSLYSVAQYNSPFYDGREEFWVHPSRAIMKAYDKTDKAILRHTPYFARGRSTAVTAILIDVIKLWVANVGESRAIVCQRGRAIRLSIDDELSTEWGSIDNKGGFVSNILGGLVY